MDINANNKKIIQITEEALSPVHVPLVIGNEFYIVTQQDVRKIEDSRILTYSKLLPNGLLKPLDNNQCDNILWACKLRSLLDVQNLNRPEQLPDHLLAALMQISQLQQQQQSTQMPIQMLQLLQQQLQQQQQQQPQPMEVSFGNCFGTQTNNNTAPLATIADQLKWEKSVNTSPLFPFTCSNATSTTGLSTVKQHHQQQQKHYRHQQEQQHNKNYTQRHVQTCCNSCCCCANCLEGKNEKTKCSRTVPRVQQNVTTQTEANYQIQGETQTDRGCDATTTTTKTNSNAKSTSFAS